MTMSLSGQSITNHRLDNWIFRRRGIPLSMFTTNEKDLKRKAKNKSSRVIKCQWRQPWRYNRIDRSSSDEPSFGLCSTNIIYWTDGEDMPKNANKQQLFKLFNCLMNISRKKNFFFLSLILCHKKLKWNLIRELVVAVRLTNQPLYN